MWAFIIGVTRVAGNGQDSKQVVKGSTRNPWKSISNELDSFLRFTSFKVGNGEYIRFWEDHWIGEISFKLPRLNRVSINESASIASLASLVIHALCPHEFIVPNKLT